MGEHTDVFFNQDYEFTGAVAGYPAKFAVVFRGEKTFTVKLSQNSIQPPNAASLLDEFLRERNM